MSELSMAEVLGLSTPERIQLVGDIWDSIAALPQPIAPFQAQREELDRRLEDYRQHPEDGSPWEEIKGHFFDTALVQARENEPRESLATVKQRLKLS